MPVSAAGGIADNALAELPTPGGTDSGGVELLRVPGIADNALAELHTPGCTDACGVELRLESIFYYGA